MSTSAATNMSANMSARIRNPIRRALHRIRAFREEERGEVAPATYLATLPIALLFIFFTLDLGLRKGARLAVEYAAFCAARSAAVYMPDPAGGCRSADAQARHAAAACLASVVGKRGVGSPESAGTVHTLVARAERQITVQLSGGCSHNGAVTAKVSYKYGPELPLSPLSSGGGLTITASAQAMLQTIK
jgi:Flp pilus assembly protein TadG